MVTQLLESMGDDLENKMDDYCANSMFFNNSEPEGDFRYVFTSTVHVYTFTFFMS